MAVNSKTHIVHQNYQRGMPPVLEENIKYLQDELQRLETTIKTIGAGSIEVLDEPPQKPTNRRSQIQHLTLGPPW